MKVNDIKQYKIFQINAQGWVEGHEQTTNLENGDHHEEFYLQITKIICIIKKWNSCQRYRYCYILFYPPNLCKKRIIYLPAGSIC